MESLFKFKRPSPPAPLPITGKGRRGVTLIEVMLTLAILAILSALAWPAVHRAFEGQRLRMAADAIRAQWTRARITAIDSGCVVSFRYQPGEAVFRVDAGQSADAALESASTGQDAASDLPTTAPKAVSDKLPVGICFMGAEVAAEETDAALGTTAGSAATPEDASGDWAPPISFYPDGTATQCTLRLQNERQRCITLSLRGLTGVVTIGDIQSTEGASP